MLRSKTFGDPWSELPLFTKVTERPSGSICVQRKARFGWDGMSHCFLVKAHAQLWFFVTVCGHVRSWVKFEDAEHVWALKFWGPRLQHKLWGREECRCERSLEVKMIFPWPGPFTMCSLLIPCGTRAFLLVLFAVCLVLQPDTLGSVLRYLALNQSCWHLESHVAHMGWFGHYLDTWSCCMSWECFIISTEGFVLAHSRVNVNLAHQWKLWRMGIIHLRIQWNLVAHMETMAHSTLSNKERSARWYWHHPKSWRGYLSSIGSIGQSGGKVFSLQLAKAGSWKHVSLMMPRCRIIPVAVNEVSKKTSCHVCCWVCCFFTIAWLHVRWEYCLLHIIRSLHRRPHAMEENAFGYYEILYFPTMSVRCPCSKYDWYFEGSLLWRHGFFFQTWRFSFSPGWEHATFQHSLVSRFQAHWSWRSHGSVLTRLYHTNRTEINMWEKNADWLVDFFFRSFLR